MGHIQIDPKWLTAAEARKLTGITAEDYVAELLEAVKIAAESRKYELKTNEAIYDLPSEFWSDEGYEKTPKYFQAIKILEDLGYETEFICDLCSFGANIYTVVSWKK